jgi:PAS domain S-box-containing protein
MKENLDYLVFCAAVAVGSVALWRLLPKWRRRARFPWPVWIAIAGVLASNWRVVDQAGKAAGQSIQHVVESLAPTYAIELARMNHHRVSGATAPDDPTYLAITEAIGKWQTANAFAQDIYTVRKLPDGRNVFIVDPETDYDRNGKFEGPTEQRTPIGKEFVEEDTGMEAAFEGKPNFNPTVVRDEWGEWVGAWAPILDPEGKVDAVVGVDFEAHQWLAAIAGARKAAIGRAAMLVALLAIGGTAIALLRADNLNRREAEERSRRTEHRMALTLQHLPLGFIEWSFKGECIGWNPTAEKIFGYRPEEVLGREIFSRIVAPGAREHVDKMWAHLINQEGGTHSIHDGATKDGRAIVCEWFNTPLTDAGGKVMGAYSLVQDITERVNLENHVQHAQRLNAVGQLAAGVAHDFNNILTIITGHAGLVLDHAHLPTDARTDLERIEQAAHRASGLTRQLLAFSRKQALFPRPLHLGAAVQTSVKMLHRIVGDDITLQTKIAPGLPPIEADPAMLDQVVTNLVLNSRDALPRGGTVEISIDRVTVDQAMLRRHPDASPGEWVCLSVADNGTGIPPDKLGRIFEPFFTTKPTGQGTGLGLAVVHGIVKQHHGWIDVESSPGNGAAFRVYLPPTAKIPVEPALPPLDATEPTPVRRQKTILLAEDESLVRNLARMILERAGYRVLDAADGVQALQLWTEHRDQVDLLLTDMMMPNGVTGRELSQRLLADEPELPIVFASGYSLELTAPDFRASDRQLFLQKPYLTEELVATVRQCLGENQPVEA